MAKSWSHLITESILNHRRHGKWWHSRRITSRAAFAHLAGLDLASAVVPVEQNLSTTAQGNSDSHRRLHRDPHHLQPEFGLEAVVGFDSDSDFDCEFDSAGHKAAANVSTGH